MKEVGPTHERKFVYSVSTETADAKVLAEGEEMMRIKHAEGSAALLMLRGLQQNNYILVASSYESNIVELWCKSL